MKNFLLLIITFSSFFFGIANGASGDIGEGSKEPIEVKVTEQIPGANCKPKTGPCPPEGCICTIEPGFNTIQSMIGGIIKWITAIAALGGVLFIVINGILLSIGGGENAKVKERITKTIVGLILLLLSGVILSIIAPWVYK